MSPETSQRLFDFRNAFAHPVPLWSTVAIAAVLAVSMLIVLVLGKPASFLPKRMTS